MEHSKTFIREAKNNAEEYLGRSITDAEWNAALPKAQRKLDHIISREGDADGERKKPYYLGKLAQEEIDMAAFTKWIDAQNKERSRPPSETAPITTPQLYTKRGAKVNATTI